MLNSNQIDSEDIRCNEVSNTNENCNSGFQCQISLQERCKIQTSGPNWIKRNVITEQLSAQTEGTNKSTKEQIIQTHKMLDKISEKNRRNRECGIGCTWIK